MMEFEYILPVIRGIQGEREYYVSMCPLGILPKLFPLPNEKLTPFQRSQRRLNKGRLRKICQSILENRYNRDAIALIVKRVVKEVSFFNNYTYLEGDRIPKTSDKLLTFYQLYQATIELLRDVSLEDDTEMFEFVLSYWQAVSYDLEANKDNEKLSQLLLHLGTFGRLLLTNYPNDWKKEL